MTREPGSWFEDGLRFTCQGCGACCRIEGYVWVDEEEIRRLAGHLDLSVARFGRRFLRRVGAGWSLVERPNHDCVFWDDGCSVYEARPEQCRTFPFWPAQLASRVAWERAARSCRGMNQGRLYPADRIRELASGGGSTDDGPTTGCGCGRR